MVTSNALTVEWHLSPTLGIPSGTSSSFVRLALEAILFLGSSLLVYLIGLTIYRYLFHPLASFPGPPLGPVNNLLWVWTLRGGRAPWTNHGWHKRYGPVVRIGANHLSFSTIDAQKTIYGFRTKDMPSMPKDPGFFTPEVDGTWNILNSIDMDQHARMRRSLSHGFCNSSIHGNEHVVQEQIDQFLHDLGRVREEDGKKGIKIVRRFNYVTFDIVGSLCFGPSFRAQFKSQAHRYEWADVMERTFFMNDTKRSLNEIPFLLNLVMWWRPSWLNETSWTHTNQTVAQTKARLAMDDTDVRQKDFVYHMLARKGPLPTIRELASHFQVIMLAGTVTTATLLSGVMYYLCVDPVRRARLVAELRTKFACLQDMTSKRVTENCEYLNAVCSEGLRIYPPAGAAHLPRVVPKGGAMISGHWVPGGTRVSVHPWSVVRDPANFHEPDKFIPERWLESEPAAHMGDRLEASQPFSLGPRGCIGKNVAYMEMRILLAKLFWLYDIEWYDDSVDLERDSKGYTLWDKPDIRILVRVREDFEPR